MARLVDCIKLKQQLEGLDFAPVAGELGQRIFAQVSKDAWANWLKYQTMLINENRLNLSDDNARRFLKQQLEFYFFGDDQ